MNLPALTNEERTLFDLLKIGQTAEKVLERVKNLCLQDNPFEGARFKWLFLAYGMEEGWLRKEVGKTLVKLESEAGLSFEPGGEFCKFCELCDFQCKFCELQPYVGYVCIKVWPFWLNGNDPTPMLQKVLQASIDKEFAEAKLACALWEGIEEAREGEEVWKPTPWLVELKTDFNSAGRERHDSFREALKDCLGEELAGGRSKKYRLGNWQEGVAGEDGMVWFGFRTREWFEIGSTVGRAFLV